jgi:aspartate/methionine/tyrosine aminotransferase
MKKNKIKITSKFLKNILYKNFCTSNTNSTANYCKYILTFLDMDFHKNKSISQSSIGFDNVFTNIMNDEICETSEPSISVSHYKSDAYIKQVMAVILNSKLLQSDKIMIEAKEKAKQYLKLKNFTVGSYSDSKGLPLARKNIAKWYMERDGYAIDENEIYLTNGTMNAYDHMISLICETGESILMPSPCYPLYINYNTSRGIENIFYEFEGIENGEPGKINVFK